MSMLVGREIKRRRRELGLSQRDLAKAAGLAHGAISFCERGERSPSVSTLERIAGGLGCRVVDLLPPESSDVARAEYVLSDTLENVQAGDLSAEDALDALRRAGILLPRRTREGEVVTR